MRRTLEVFVALFGALTLLGFLGRFWWPFELVSFFRPWEAIVLVVVGVVALVLRYLPVGAAALALAALNVAVVAAATWERPDYPRPVPGSTVRLLLLNVFGENNDYDAVAGLIRSERADVVGLTELTPTMADAIAPALARYRARAAAPLAGYFGIGLYGTRRTLRRPRIETFAEGARNAAVGVLRLGGRRATLVVVHPPFPITPGGAEDRSSQLDAIADAVERGELGRRVAVCGDLNAPSWTATARRLVDAGLTDTASGERLEGTWPSFLPGPLRLPFDNCLIRGLTLVSRSTGRSVGSDHLPLVVELALPDR